MDTVVTATETVEATPEGKRTPFDPNIDWESARGAKWAKWDPETATKYSGLWAVVRHNQVIAHGEDPDAVGAEASRITGIPQSQLVVCALASPDTWFW